MKANLALWGIAAIALVEALRSHFGFIGVFVSLLVSHKEREIWDARATDAT